MHSPDCPKEELGGALGNGLVEDEVEIEGGRGREGGRDEGC